MTQISASMIKELRERTGIGMAKCKSALTEANGDLELAIVNLRKAGLASAGKKEGRETKEGVIASCEHSNTVSLVEVNSETDFVAKNSTFQEFVNNIALEVANTKPASLADFLQQKYSKDTSISIDEYRALVIQKVGENINIKRLAFSESTGDNSFGVYNHMAGKIVVLVEISGADDKASLAKDIAMHIAAENPDFLDSNEIPADLIEKEKEIAREQVKGKPENIIDKIIAGKLNAFFDQTCLVKQKFVKDPSLTIAELVTKHGKESQADLTIKRFTRWAVGE